MQALIREPTPGHEEAANHKKEINSYLTTICLSPGDHKQRISIDPPVDQKE
jgi:hypothetical protein